MALQITAKTAVTVPADFTTSPDLVLGSATFNVTFGPKTISDLTLLGTFNNDADSFFTSKFYAVVSTVAYAATPPDSVAVKDVTPTSKQNTFLLTLNTLPSGEKNLKFLNSAGNADYINFARIDATASNFFIYVMREVYNSAPALDNTKFSKDYIPIVITNNLISVGDATVVPQTSVTLGGKTYTLKYAETIVEKTFNNNLNVSYYVRINTVTRNIIEVLDAVTITAEAGSKKSLAKASYAAIQALQAQIQALLQAQTQASLGTSVLTFNTNLWLGTFSGDVSRLQQFLISKGYPIDLAAGDGFFGLSTRDALIKFQTDNGISPALGYFGATTRAKVNAILAGSTGDSGTDVSTTVTINYNNTTGQVISKDSETITSTIIGNFSVSTDKTLTFTKSSGETIVIGKYTNIDSSTYIFTTSNGRKTFVNYASGYNFLPNVTSDDGDSVTINSSSPSFTIGNMRVNGFIVDPSPPIVTPPLISRDTVTLLAGKWITGVSIDVGTGNVDIQFANTYDQFLTGDIRVLNSVYLDQFRTILKTTRSDLDVLNRIIFSVTRDSNDNIIIDVDTKIVLSTIGGKEINIVASVEETLVIKKLLIGLKTSVITQV